MTQTDSMKAELDALVGAIAKALEMSEADAAKAIEDGRIAIELAADETGNRYVAVTCGDRNARIYQGAILHGGG